MNRARTVWVFVAGLVVIGAAFVSANQPDAANRSIDANRLTYHTLIFPDEQGRENLIHFGRFGTFDWYFPCQFESGSWSLGDDLILSLRFDSPHFAPRAYQLARRDDVITLSEPGSDHGTVASLAEGNRLPFG